MVPADVKLCMEVQILVSSYVLMGTKMSSLPSECGGVGTLFRISLKSLKPKKKSPTVKREF